jgi:hypothetical protein
MFGGRSKGISAGCEDFLLMRLFLKQNPALAARSAHFLVLLIGLLAAVPARAVSCTSQAELTRQDREALSAVTARLSNAIAAQDFSSLQTALLPAVAGDWDGIRAVAEQAGPLIKGGQIMPRNAYLLDATALTAPADTQFFCSDAAGSTTVTINMRALPPGRYAVVLADSVGAPLAGQVGFILAWDGSGPAPAWKLGGLSARQGVFDGHDALWYWTKARDLGKAASLEAAPDWAAWYCYEATRYLEVPMDFLSSPALEKLGQEQALLKNTPTGAFPYTLADGPHNWKIDSIQLDASLHQADLAVTYESLGVADPAVARTEAVTVLSALLKAQPGLREGFHGLWAYAQKDGKRTFAIELPMAQIP